MGRRGGRLVVRVRSHRHRDEPVSGGVRISVADTGMGIRPEHRDKIFEAFYTTKESTGTGLGLWLSRTLVQKHGGSIRMRSSTSSPQTGTVFSIFWPCEPPGKAPSLCKRDPVNPTSLLLDFSNVLISGALAIQGAFLLLSRLHGGVKKDRLHHRFNPGSHLLGVTDAAFLTAGGTMALSHGRDRDAFLASYLQAVQTYAQAI